MNEEEIKQLNEIKKWLKRYRKNQAIKNRLVEKLQHVVDSLDVKAVRFSSEPRGTNVKTKEDLILEKIELEERIKRMDQRGKVFRKEILEMIDQVDNLSYAEILEMFFIDGMSLEDIADELCYTKRHTIRLYSKGIREILKMKKNNLF